MADGSGDGLDCMEPHRPLEGLGLEWEEEAIEGFGGEQRHGVGLVVKGHLGGRAPRAAAGTSWGIIRVGDDGGWTLEVDSG